MSTPIAPLGDPDAGARGATGSGQGKPATREIVVGVDGSEIALGAVRWAAQEAARRGAPLRILHAATYLGHRGPSGAPPPELPRARRITAQAYTVARHTERDVRASTEVVPNEPVTSLLRAAAAAQLVVLGSPTTGAADEMVLASLTLRVAARSPLPVVVVPRQRAATTNQPIVAVLGIGDPEDDEQVAAFAAGEAVGSGVPLTVMDTRSPGRTSGRPWTGDDGEWERRYPGLQVRRTELPDATGSQLLAATCPTPLLVMSAGHPRLLNRTLDGPHRWLLRHCTSPMALVPPVHRPAQQPEQREQAAVR